MSRYFSFGVATERSGSGPSGEQPNGVSYGYYGAAPLSSQLLNAGIKTDENGTDSNGSPNNRVSQRSNQDRINGRIPDIYGKVLSVPDLIAKPYTVYIGNNAYDIGYFCIGRGSYSLSNVLLNGTLASAVSNAAYDRYIPNSSPKTDLGSVAVNFIAPAKSVGQLSNELSSPIHIKAPNTTFYPQDSTTVGPFVFENCSGGVVNVSCPFLFSGGSFISRTINFDIKCRLVTESNVPYGATHTTSGSISVYNQIAYTSVYFNPTFSGRMQVTITRTSNWTSPETDSVHILLRLTGIFGNIDFPESHFGNVTTLRIRNPVGVDTTGENIRTTTPNTMQVSCTAHRILNAAATSNFAEAVEDVCYDPKLGNLSADQVDIANLNDIASQVETYFGTSLAAEFNYTFDDETTSFEQMVTTICEAVFVTAYRQGNKIKFSFDKVDNPVKLLFNHRNKIPNSEIRNLSFGYLNDYDGVIYEYTDIADGAKLKLTLPADESANNYNVISPVGITNKLQAYFHAKRALQRQTYQNMVIEFEATQEAYLLEVTDKIIVADDTRSQTYAGEVVAKDGLELTLSQPFTFEAGTTVSIFLQLVTGEVEEIEISSVSGNSYKVLLSTEPSEDLALLYDNFARATYEIVVQGSARREPFIVTQKSPSDTMIVAITAVNYDSRYYSHDKDYINSIVDINGDLI